MIGFDSRIAKVKSELHFRTPRRTDLDALVRELMNPRDGKPSRYRHEAACRRSLLRDDGKTFTKQRLRRAVRRSTKRIIELATV